MLTKKKLISYFKYLEKVCGDTLYFDVPLVSVPQSVHIFDTPKIAEHPIITPSKTTTPKTKLELPDISNISGLGALKQVVLTCNSCILSATRHNVVFGEGNPHAKLMVIGEAPGADEDEQGKPFVGRAGKLLTDILKAINLAREEVFIANICKCRPPGNRRPETDEVMSCEQFLYKQIELIQPKLILALGLTAAECLFKQKLKMGDVRGTIINFRGIKTMITYHPAALLRNPNWKRPVWEDVQRLRALYDEM